MKEKFNFKKQTFKVEFDLDTAVAVTNLIFLAGFMIYNSGVAKGARS